MRLPILTGKESVGYTSIISISILLLFLNSASRAASRSKVRSSNKAPQYWQVSVGNCLHSDHSPQCGHFLDDLKVEAIAMQLNLICALNCINANPDRTIYFLFRVIIFRQQVKGNYVNSNNIFLRLFFYYQLTISCLSGVLL